MTEKIQFIPSRLKNAAVGGHVAGSEDIIDENMNMTQNDVNATFRTAINALDGQNYVTVETYASLPATGAVNTIYRVSNYDGAQSQVDATKYSEYAWNGSTYVLLDVKPQIGEVYDISAAHSGQTYADLAAALDGGNNVPEGIRKGGMSIKFVLTSDNKYMQYRLTAKTFSTNKADWQGFANVLQNTNTKGQQLFIGDEKIGNLDNTFNVNSYNDKADAYANPTSARAAVPMNVRSLGLTITYLFGNRWVTEQFNGTSLNQWDDSNKWQQTNATILFTNSWRLNSVLKDIYIDKSKYTGQSSLNGLKLENFGYYQPTNIFFGNLKDENNVLIETISVPFNTIVSNGGVYESDMIYIAADWMEFYNNTPHQISVTLNDVCFIKNKIGTKRIEDNAVTKDKIANGAVGTNQVEDNALTGNKIQNDTITNDKLKAHLSIYGDNIISQATKNNNSFWSHGSNAPSSASHWYWYEISVEQDEIYKINATAGSDARLWTILNASNERISESPSGTISNKLEVVTIPANGTKLIINSRVDIETDINPPILQIKIPDKIDANQVYVGNKSVVDFINQQNSYNVLRGKKLVCCGDSITYGADMDEEGMVERTIEMYAQGSNGVVTEVTSLTVRASYGYQIAARNEMIFCNAGVSGSTMQGLSNKAGFSLANGRYTTLPDDIDYLTIWFGYNDEAYGTLGEISDTTNESYYGGYNVVLPYLINKYPYTKIALIVPYLDDYSGDSSKAANMREAVRLLANKWGVACFDMFQGGTPLYYQKEASVGVNPLIVAENKAKFQANGAHPNFKGHRQLSNMLEEFLRGI